MEEYMFLINSISYILQIDCLIWVLGAFGFFGIMMLLRKLITGGK